MNAVDRLERHGQGSRWRLAILLAAGSLLIVAAFVGWSRDDPNSTYADVQVLSGAASRTSNLGKSTPGQGQGNNPGNGQPAPPVSLPHTFGIAGNLEGLYPTFDGQLRVTFSNPHSFEIVVTELDVVPSVPGGACADGLADVALAIGDVLRFDDELGTGVSVPRARNKTAGTSTVDVRLTVSSELPDACQDMTFELDYTGTAVRANQT